MAKILVVDDRSAGVGTEPIEDAARALSRLAAVPGVTLAVVVDREGFVIESAGDRVFEAEAVGALAASLAEASEVIGRDLSHGSFVGLIAEHEAGLVLVSRAEAGAMLVACRGVCW
jgi:predicted regulator of Ras-like GTPase activity (Roadblock/LC7/MglB family)